MSSLFEISDAILHLNDQLDNLDDEDLDDEALATIQEFLAGLLKETINQRDHKLDNYGALIREIKLRASVRKQEAERLIKLSRFDENRANRLEECLFKFLAAHNLKKLDTTRFRFSVCVNGGKLPLVLDEELEPDDFPEEYTYPVTVVDKVAIREALEAGKELTFAKLGERGSHLRIR